MREDTIESEKEVEIRRGYVINASFIEANYATSQAILEFLEAHSASIP